MVKSKRATTLARILPIAILALVALAPAAAATHAWTTVFLEEFDAPLDPAVWTADPHTGSIVVSGGAVTLTGGTYFPTITTTDTMGPLFPAGIPFRATIDVQYTNYNTHGTGISQGPFGMWQDSGGIGGTRLSFAGQSQTFSADLARHVIEYQWDGTTATMHRDATLHFSTPWSGTGDTNLGFGNPTECCPGNSDKWNNLKVYSVRVEQLTDHPPPPVPEMSALALVAAGLVGVGVVLSRQRTDTTRP